MNSRIKTWTNSFIRIYPKLTTIEHNKTYFVGKSLNPPQQGSLAWAADSKWSSLKSQLDCY